MAKPKKPRKIDLPDHLVHKTPHGPGSARNRHKKEYQENVKDKDLNPEGKEDFEKLLWQAIRTKGSS